MISIIVPVYNSEKTIVLCISSLLKQKTSNEFEIIAVNDASTDGTKKKLLEFGKKIVLLENPENKGPAFSRNLGAKKAKGEIVCFTDSDCIAEKNWLKEMIAPFANENVAAVQGRYLTQQKSLVAKFVQEEIEQRYDLLRKAKNIDWVGSYSAAYRRDVFLAEGGFDESFPIASGEDPDLSFRVAKKGHKIIFAEKAVVYHTHPDSLLKYLKTKYFRAYFRVLLYKKHPDKAIKDSYTPQTLKFRISGFFAAPLVLLALLVFIPQNFLQFFLFCVVFYFATAMPFFFHAIGKDAMVAIFSPLLLFLRDMAFAAGLLMGTIKTVFK